MSWEQVIAQDRAKHVLQTALARDRVAHAYLFYGPYGVGKRAAAFAFARALQCKVHRGEGCTNCSDCSRIDRMIHPDVRFLMPSPTNVDQEEITERLLALGQNPYDTVDFIRRPTGKSTRSQAFYAKDPFLEDVRLVVDFVAFEGNYKVVTILDAEALGDVTGNLFLKRLEEPSPRSVFILITERPERLLPTILSRCQPVRFDPLSQEDLERALIEREGLPKSEAASCARLAEGSFSAARDLLHDEVARSFREQLVPFLRQAYDNKVDDVLETVERVSGQTLDQIKLFLSLLAVLVRDLMLVRELGEDAPIVNVSERESMLKFVGNLASARLDQMASLVDEAWYLVARNVKPTLVLVSLAAALRASMNGENAPPLVTPLAEQIVADLE